MSTTEPRRGNRIAVVLSAAALVMSVGFAGGPAIAKALNADTVDHKHAVGAKASVKARKGKLVATDKRTGLLPNNIIAVAPKAKTATTATNAGNAANLGGQPAASYLTKAEVNEVVGLGATPTLPAAGVTTSTATFTTTKTGRLLVEFTGSGQLQCPSSSFVRWWIQVDGTPILSSSMQLGEAVTISFDYAGFPAIHLTGITADAVPAGDHTVALAGGCTSGANGGSATSGTAGVGSVTVLANGLAPTPSARHAARKSCVSAASGRSCR
ncbi:hypothetical protein ASC77_16145 [Nocardioides sp. Root1257]|uniref:hypothetical protein n=1 Tax=unclassified Nocardioides TaxID=2615069 RepID=UPI0006F9F800|nr:MULTISPECIES: hypothetical protein [unclassified Nocardioides]KQW47937.1 hypothetical protein ASC77_16145 [Nocardioides sp. Root1257]KRC45189.1 hypothetical protein ASE24_17095 [Nocardioides sp. Root224]